MAPGAHALLGASSAKRWLGCPPSARLVERLGLPDEGSEFAEAGTEAHALAELKLRLATGEITKRQFSSRMRAHKNNKHYDAEMEDATDAYVSFVRGLVEALADEAGEEPLVELEQRVDFSAYVPEGFGTADCVIISSSELHVIDLKYGKGVEVSAEDNPQLKLYALGALDRYALVYGVETVRTTIMQPRLGNVSCAEYGADELAAWGRDYVAPRAEQAWAGEGEYGPGEDTCRWCRAKAVCRARADAALSAARDDFDTLAIPDPGVFSGALGDVELLGDGEVARLLALCPLMEAWCKDIRAWALDRALEGRRFEGWKLVEGRSTRKIADPEAVMNALEAAGVPAESYLKPYELQTITALTRALGKARFSALVEPHVVKPAGKPALVPAGDKRPEIGSAAGAAEDFKA